MSGPEAPCTMYLVPVHAQRGAVRPARHGTRTPGPAARLVRPDRRGLPQAPRGRVAAPHIRNASASATLSTTAASPPRSQGNPPMATFVIVHGAWSGGYAWNRRVAPLLRSGGHDVYTPTLTGLGE